MIAENVRKPTFTIKSALSPRKLVQKYTYKIIYSSVLAIMKKNKKYKTEVNTVYMNSKTSNRCSQNEIKSKFNVIGFDHHFCFVVEIPGSWILAKKTGKEQKHPSVALSLVFLLTECSWSDAGQKG